MNRSFLTLIKREFWENKSLWIAPLALAGLIVVAAMLAPVGSRGGSGVQIGPASLEASRQFSAVSLRGAASMLAIGGAVAVLAYLLDCLFAERRDRSILFWKSLPVSDAQTVLAKLAVAMVVVPFGIIVLAMLIQPIVGLITWLRFESLRPHFNSGLFAAWPDTLGQMVAAWVFMVCWYAPVAAYLMLASVLAKRVPWTYATLPPVLLMVAEKLMFDTVHVRTFLAERLFPWVASRMSHLPGSMYQPPGAPRTGLNLVEAFQDVNLWAGIAVAAGMLYIVIRLRRYRDDT
jgi:ABC-2 type transport system permease protein